MYNKQKVSGQLIESKEKVKPDDFEFLKAIGWGSFGKVMQVRKQGMIYYCIIALYLYPCTGCNMLFI